MTERGPRVPLLPAATVCIIFAGLILRLSGNPLASDRLWLTGLFITALPLFLQTARAASRGNFATDAVATLAIVSALILREPLPGLIIVLMQSGGQALERMAHRRASRALSQLE